MIEGFEKYTGKLTDYELNMAEVIAKGLRGKIGKENAITSGRIISAMTNSGYELTGARLRKIINYLRTSKKVENLICSSDGYYRTEDPEEILRYIKSLEHRAEAILAVARSFFPKNKEVYELEN